MENEEIYLKKNGQLSTKRSVRSNHKNNKDCVIPFVVILNIFFIAITTIWFFTLSESMSDWVTQRYVISLFTTILLILNLIANRKKQIKLFSLYNVFFLFFALFNFGQCFLWTFGIHLDKEIGEVSAYGIYLHDESIIKAELLSAIAIISFNTGNLLRKRNLNNNDSTVVKNVDYTKILKIIGLILFIPSYCVTMYLAISKMGISLKYGYLNASIVADSTANTFLVCLQRLFIPSVFCIIIGYGYSRKVFFLMLAFFLPYMIVGIIIGDRGEWLYSLFLFALIYHEKIKTIEFRQWIIIWIVGVIALTVLSSIRENRNDVNTFVSFGTNYSLSDNAVTKSIAEMGNSMQVAGVIVQAGENPYPYGNTYLLSLLGIFSDKVVRVFVPNYVDLNSWFSKDYLRLNGWGAGFSSVAEAYMNGGVIGLIILFLIFGYFISKILTNTKSDLGYIFAIIVFIGAMGLARGTMSYNLKILFFDLVVIGLLFYVAKDKTRKEMKCKNH